MRSSIYILAAVAGFGLIVLSTPRADAMNSTASAGLRAGLEAVDLIEPVDCRSYKHKHERGHRWGTGCKPGVVIRGGASSGPSISIESGTNRSGNRSDNRSGSSSGRGSSSNSTTTNNSTTNTGTGAGATTSTSTTTGGATYTGAGAGATSTSTEATTTTGGATTTTGGTGSGATKSTTGGTAGGTAPKK